MKIYKKTLLSVLLSCIVVYVQAQTEEPGSETLLQIDFSHKHYSLTASFTNQVYNDKSYVEASCTDGEYEQFKDKDCEVTLINFDDSSVTRNQTCQTGFHTDRGILKSLFVHQERNDTVVLPYLHVVDLNEVYFKFRMLHMSTCEFIDVPLPIDSRILKEPTILPQILMYDDGSFELFVPNTKDSCHGARCKLTFDSSGEQIGEPVGYLSNNMSDHAIFFVHGPTAKNYYAFVGVQLPLNATDPDDKNSKLYFVNETTSTKLISFDFNYRQFIDDSNGRFGFCFSSTNDTKNFVVNCTQYYKDKQIIDMKFELREALPLAAYNVLGGGILFVSSKCDSLICENVVFREITLNNTVKFRHFDEFAFIKPSLTDVSDGDYDRLCLTLYTPRSRLHMTKKCYPTMWVPNEDVDKYEYF